MKINDSLGGSVPLRTEEFANRAFKYTLNPLRNPVKEIMDQCSSVEDTPPFLGIFNDIPWNKFRENEAHAWAKAASDGSSMMQNILNGRVFMVESKMQSRNVSGF